MKRGFQVFLCGLLACMVVFVWAGAVLADQESHTVSVTIPESLKLRLSGDVQFQTPPDYPPDSFENYYLGPNYVTVSVHCNRDIQWQVKVAAQTATFSGPSGVDKPITDLEWSLNQDSGYTAMSTSQADVFGGSQHTNGWQEQNVYYKLKLTGTELAGDYSATIIYTLVTP